MKFEVINDKGRTMMSTTCLSCIPDADQIDAMIKYGYKFKINGKSVPKKKVIEFINNKGAI